MTSGEKYEAGDLEGAIESALQAVKADPGNTAARYLLCEFLCFAGDLERADKQLQTIGRQDHEAMLAVHLFRQLIRAELSRYEHYRAGRLPEFLEDISPAAENALRVSLAVRENDPKLSDLMLKAEAERSQPSGKCNGTLFEDFRDLDDVAAAILEVYTPKGQYVWLPFLSIETIAFFKPERARDVLWRHAEITTSSGATGDFYVPCLYVDSSKAEDVNVQLGRSTEWRGEAGQPVRGAGQKMWLVGDEALSIHQIDRVEFNSPNK